MDKKEGNGCGKVKDWKKRWKMDKKEGNGCD